MPGHRPGILREQDLLANEVSEIDERSDLHGRLRLCKSPEFFDELSVITCKCHGSPDRLMRGALKALWLSCLFLVVSLSGCADGEEFDGLDKKSATVLPYLDRLKADVLPAHGFLIELDEISQNYRAHKGDEATLSILREAAHAMLDQVQYYLPEGVAHTFATTLLSVAYDHQASFAGRDCEPSLYVEVYQEGTEFEDRIEFDRCIPRVPAGLEFVNTRTSDYFDAAVELLYKLHVCLDPKHDTCEGVPEAITAARAAFHQLHIAFTEAEISQEFGFAPLLRMHLPLSVHVSNWDSFSRDVTVTQQLVRAADGALARQESKVFSLIEHDAQEQRVAAQPAWVKNTTGLVWTVTVTDELRARSYEIPLGPNAGDIQLRVMLQDGEFLATCEGCDADDWPYAPAPVVETPKDFQIYGSVLNLDTENMYRISMVLLKAGSEEPYEGTYIIFPDNSLWTGEKVEAQIDFREAYDAPLKDLKLFLETRYYGEEARTEGTVSNTYRFTDAPEPTFEIRAEFVDNQFEIRCEGCVLEAI